MYKCYYCGHETVAWQCDYDFEDYGYDGNGIVQTFHCANCDADIEYAIPFPLDVSDDEEGQR